MIKQSGHLFHIDFAKFLGASQMFGNFKRWAQTPSLLPSNNSFCHCRDRVPFVLTSDMAYVINGGGRQSSHFQSFVDQCCRAFNILRKHRILLVNLFSLVSTSLLHIKPLGS
jgi:phosphatidylinositol-4-phosphate 3-kinase